ncbi:hypothetical protein DIPPA_09866 [Diplonema papillatum]|nr:hypothetical protein DIPPA_09866 [Diplonema papillatum]
MKEGRVSEEDMARYAADQADLMIEASMRAAEERERARVDESEKDRAAVHRRHVDRHEVSVAGWELVFELAVQWLVFCIPLFFVWRFFRRSGADKLK